jgi:DNA mismatch endonuclease (patch repair protein)
MVDTLDKEARSRHMGLIRQAGTSPELAVRGITHRLGFRFRVSRRDLPGCPDIVLPGRRAVIFVHGCFWHRHEGCPRSTTPKTSTDFWMKKFVANQARDRASLEALAKLGWRTLVIWECETRDKFAVAERLKIFLGPQERP